MILNIIKLMERSKYIYVIKSCKKESYQNEKELIATTLNYILK